MSFICERGCAGWRPKHSQVDIDMHKRTQDPGGPEIQQDAEHEAVHDEAERIPAHISGRGDTFLSGTGGRNILSRQSL